MDKNETADDTAGQKARRTWITIGEAVGVLALLLSGLSFWDAHRDRQRQADERAQSQVTAGRQASFVLTADVQADGEALRLRPAKAEQLIQSQRFLLPAALRHSPVEITGDARIEAGWFSDGRDALRGGGRDGGDQRVTIGVESTYLADGEVRTDQSLYNIGYAMRARFLRGSEVELKGISLVRRGVKGDLQAAVEAAWNRQHGGQAGSKAK